MAYKGHVSFVHYIETLRRLSKDGEEIDQLEKEGHSYHCACRQVWGDGECECSFMGKERDDGKKNREKATKVKR